MKFVQHENSLVNLEHVTFINTSDEIYPTENGEEMVFFININFISGNMKRWAFTDSTKRDNIFSIILSLE